MTALSYLIPIALMLGALGVAAFFWSLNAGQYEDLEGAARRILTDSDLDEQDRRQAGFVSRPVSSEDRL